MKDKSNRHEGVPGIILIFVIIGVILLGIGIKGYIRQENLLKNGREIQGVITQINEYIYDEEIRYEVIIEYEVNRKTYYVRPDNRVTAHGYKVGDAISVICLEDNPANALVGGRFLKAQSPLSWMLFGGFFICFPLGAIGVSRSSNNSIISNIKIISFLVGFFLVILLLCWYGVAQDIKAFSIAFIVVLGFAIAAVIAFIKCNAINYPFKKKQEESLQEWKIKEQYQLYKMFDNKKDDEPN